MVPKYLVKYVLPLLIFVVSIWILPFEELSRIEKKSLK